jgi:hypothetical protein
MMDEEDDDGYFDSIQQSIEEIDDSEQEIDNLHSVKFNISFQSEEEYFQLIQENANIPSLILPESSFVWQALKAEMGLMHRFKLENLTSAIFGSIQEWLLNCMPLSGRALCAMKNIQDFANVPLWIDDFDCPNLLVYRLKQINSQEIGFSLFSPKNSTEVIQPYLITAITALLEETKSSNGGAFVSDCEVVIHALDDHLTEPCSTAMNRIGYVESWRAPCGLFVYQGTRLSLSADLPPLPPGYEFWSLTDSDVNIINETWKFKWTESVGYLTSMIHQLPCASIRYTGR